MRSLEHASFPPHLPSSDSTRCNVDDLHALVMFLGTRVNICHNISNFKSDSKIEMILKTSLVSFILNNCIVETLAVFII